MFRDFPMNMPRVIQEFQEGEPGTGRFWQPFLDPQGLSDRLDRELKLGKDQRSKMGAVLEETMPKVRKLDKEIEEAESRRRKLQDEMKDLVGETREKMRQTLKTGQKDKFDDFMFMLRHRGPARKPQEMPGVPEGYEEEERRRMRLDPDKTRDKRESLPPPEMFGLPGQAPAPQGEQKPK